MAGRRHTVLKPEAPHGGAVISECQEYRYWLWRSLLPRINEAVAWVLNNPSTADAKANDPTVAKAWKYTTDWGFESMIFVNTNPHRSTDPALARVPPFWAQLNNDRWLIHAMRHSKVVVCGWGDKANPELAKRAVTVAHALGPLSALRVTKQGNPQHPLYLPGNLKPIVWNPEKWLH